MQLLQIGSFEKPVYVTSPPGDDRLFVVEQTGRIWVLVDGRRRPRPFLDLSRKAYSENLEGGLLSLAFAPDYATSGHFYVDYTDREYSSNVVEYRRSADPDVADPTSARRVVLVESDQDRHHGGHLRFGPDGMLYISQGDGGTSSETNFPAQDLEDLHGKILRIDPRPQDGRPYGIPPDNPFVGRPGRDEIWVYGLRNPWRFNFDAPSGALVIGDVGQLSTEEIDIATRPGQNFGWSCLEGSRPFFPEGPPCDREFVPPAIENFRGATPVVDRGNVEPAVTRGRPRVDTRLRAGGKSCSAVAGVYVEDPELRDLVGRHVYGDFCDTSLRSFRLENSRAVDVRELGVTVPITSSFGTDSRGRVYVTSLAGPVFRLVAP